MAIAVEMPKMSDTMEEGVLVAWLAEEGDSVSAGDVIGQVETDKATMDLEVYDDGVLLKRVIAEGDAVPIGGLIAVLGEEGEDISDILAKYGGGDAAADEAEPAEADETEEGAEEGAPEAAEAEQEQPAAQKKTTSAPAPSGDGAATPQPAPVSGSQEGGRIKASPLARKLAGDHGVDLASIQGTGPQGRIIKRDVEAAVGQPEAKPAAAPEAKPDREPAKAPRPAPMPVAEGAEEYEAIRISQMRKAITRRLGQSKFTAPHFYLTVDIDMERAIAARQQLNEMAAAQERPKISFNDLVIKACAVALHEHPMVNASYMEEEGEIRKYNQVHIGVAVAVDEGLVTPVVRNADRKGLARIGEEVREMAGRARERKLQPEEMAGSTFTTSNLGMFGIEEFTAIINPPNACILAIGAIRDVPVVKDGAVVPGKRMKVTLSCDHRVVDGATGAQFLQTVKQYLEEPLSLLL